MNNLLKEYAMKKWSLIAVVGMMVTVMAAMTVSARTYEGVEVPEVVETENSILLLNGTGERVVFDKQLYVAGLYLQAPETDWQEVVEADAPMAIQMQVTNAVVASSDMTMNAINSGFRSNMPGGDISSIKDKVEAFKACFSDFVYNDDKFLIEYIPDVGTTVYKNGEKKDTIPGYEFKKAAFSIWIGKKPAQKSMRAGMLAGDVSEQALALKEKKEAQRAKAAELAEKKKAAELAEKRAAEKRAEEKAAKAEAARKERMAEKKAEQARLKKRFVSENIYFPLGENQLAGPALKKVAEKVEWMKANPDVTVIIEGHSDSRGPSDLNKKLAEKRARQVKAHMVEAGIAAERMEVVSYGEDRPAVKGENPEAWSKNRRVHFRIVE